MINDRLRFPVMVLAMLALLAALWAGLVRLGWRWPTFGTTLPMAHGPLMVSGFLGTLISVERAVALGKRWTYLAPALSGLGGLALVLGIKGSPGPLLLTLGSLGLVVIFAVIIRSHPALYTFMMGGGALAWLASNLIWLSGAPVYQVAFWWAGFLILTIAGERLELGRLVQLQRAAEIAFVAAAGIFVAGLVWLGRDFEGGTRLASLGMVGMAAWLLRYDIARHTIRKGGLPRFAAACLLSGYFWLAAAGVMGLTFGSVVAGFQYDALLHAIFLGFVFSMIFGHAPIIFPAVLGLPITFHRVLYAHLVLLHTSLALRVSGDLAANQAARQWGGLLNGIALLLFLGSTAFTAVVLKPPLDKASRQL